MHKLPLMTKNDRNWISVRLPPNQSPLSNITASTIRSRTYVTCSNHAPKSKSRFLDFVFTTTWTKVEAFCTLDSKKINLKMMITITCLQKLPSVNKSMHNRCPVLFLWIRDKWSEVNSEQFLITCSKNTLQ